MNNTQAIMKEIQSVREAYAESCERLEQAQAENKVLLNMVKELAEKTESQAVYTAMMTDTLTEAE